ncbi:MAG: hypothetical protein R3176_01685 [Woeseiaceae bacterium]|nr:hypothetical protein [Woeseiaceae bacterium]
MTFDRGVVFVLFKYAVYVLLAMNVYWFFVEEYGAALVEYPGGVPFAELSVAYVATIDTAAWVVLLLLFELETYLLDDRHFTRPVTLTLHGLRIVCYAFIVSAFIDYIQSLLFVRAVAPLAGIGDLCVLAADGWSYAVSLDEYVPVTAGNCATLSPAESFLRFEHVRAVVDAGGHAAIMGLAWIDVINSGVWLLVVLVLEIDVRLQERELLEGWALKLSTATKVVLYSTLLYAAVYWGIKGSFVDFWDAFLWLVAFVFIELNVFEWRAEEREAKSA